jgi:hypothetical protein
MKGTGRRRRKRKNHSTIAIILNEKEEKVPFRHSLKSSTTKNMIII